MPKRPRSHEIEDISRRRLRDIFGTCGWVVWDLYPDYGEDFLVRIFTDAIATHFSFFVQAKGTDTIDNYVRDDGKYLYFPIDVDHLEHWDKFWEPVILTIWDAKADITYWEIIQDSLQRKQVASSRRKTMSVRVPIVNVLNEHGLQEIVVRTKRRFRRFERLSSGA